MMLINKAYDMMRKVKGIVGDEVADDEYMKVWFYMMYQEWRRYKYHCSKNN